MSHNFEDFVETKKKLKNLCSVIHEYLEEVDDEKIPGILLSI